MPRAGCAGEALPVPSTPQPSAGPGFLRHASDSRRSGALTPQDTPSRAPPFPPRVLPAATCMPRYSLRMESCPRCGAQRPAALLECPRCGVIYAKAEARAAALEPARAAVPEPAFALEGGPDFEGGPALEASIRTWAIPAALLCAFLLVSTGPGRAV